jgi:hypothetical protein
VAFTSNQALFLLGTLPLADGTFTHEDAEHLLGIFPDLAIHITVTVGGQVTFNGGVTGGVESKQVGGQVTFNGGVTHHSTATLGGLLTFQGAGNTTVTVAIGGTVSFIGRIRGYNPLWIEIHAGERWLGVWAIGTAYIAGDVVLYTDGALMHAFKSKVAANTGHLPTDQTWWDRLVQQTWK